MYNAINHLMEINNGNGGIMENIVVLAQNGGGDTLSGMSISLIVLTSVLILGIVWVFLFLLNELRNDIQENRKSIQGVSGEMRDGLNELRNDIRDGLSKVRGEMRGGL